MNFFEKRRIRERSREVLHLLKHALRWREDIGEAADVSEVRAQLQALHAARRAADWAQAAALCPAGEAAAAKLFPPPAHPRWRENVELLVVALGLAMTCRTYFVQPFKIPTGSMQPTLNGITGRPLEDKHAVWYRNPLLKIFPLAVLGERYVEIKAKTGGQVWINRNGGVMVGNRAYSVPLSFLKGTGYLNPEKSLDLHVQFGARAKAGDLLASGIRKLGDHVLVNKMAYHFRKPRRGDVIVFDTTGIDAAARQQSEIPADTFYIKRLVGLPGETVTVKDKRLVVDGEIIREPEIFQTLAESPEYMGYVSPGDSLLKDAGRIQVPGGEFLAFGDNTFSSLDGRYFGGVPTGYIVGPAVAVYWPFAPHWGRIP